MSKPAARLTDMQACTLASGPVPNVGGPIVGPCMPTVLIGGLPAARVTDQAVCPGPPNPIAMGSATVLIGGLPAARIGDMMTHGGAIATGCPTVLIGDQSNAGGVAMADSAAQAAALARAAEDGKPFCLICFLKRIGTG